MTSDPHKRTWNDSAGSLVPPANQKVGRVRFSLLSFPGILVIALAAGLAWTLAVQTERPENLNSSRIQIHGHNARVNSILFAPDGVSVITCSNDRAVKVWGADLKKMSRIRVDARPESVLPHAAEVFAAAFTYDGRLLATLERDMLTLWRCNPNSYELIVRQPGGPYLCLAWDPSGRRLAIGFVDGMLWLLEMPEARQSYERLAHKGLVRELAFTPDGRTLVSSGVDGKVILWDVVEGRQLDIIRDTPGTANVLAIAPDGREIAMGAYGSGPTSVILWDSKTSRIRSRLIGHEDGNSGLSYSRDGRFLASGSLDQTIRYWDPHSGSILASFREPDGKIRTLAVSPDGDRVAYTIGDETFRIREVGGLDPPELACKSELLTRCAREPCESARAERRGLGSPEASAERPRPRVGAQRSPSSRWGEGRGEGRAGRGPRERPLIRPTGTFPPGGGKEL